MSKLDYNWTFGRGAHIEFQGGGDPVDMSPQGTATREGCATISDDATGALLFYTDGSRLYDALDNLIPPNPVVGLGGGTRSCHSAIIVPPAGGGSRYHIFGVRAWGSPAPSSSPLTYTAVTVSAGVAIVAQPTQLTSFGPALATEQVAAVCHADCDKYWVVTVDRQTDMFHSLLIDSDSGPSGAATHWKTSPYPPTWVPWHEQYMRFSPDGSLIALVSATTIDIVSFSRTTGLVTAPYAQITGLAGNQAGYGLEFSPSGQYLYFTGRAAGYVRRFAVPASATTTPTPLSATTLIATLPPSPVADRAGALQRAPNGKIYGVKPNTNGLFEIAAPDSASAGFAIDALAANGLPLAFTGFALCQLGLPNFVRIPADCLVDDRCVKLAAEVDELIASNELHNSMLTCKGEPPAGPHCEPVDIPPLEPQVYIRWGDSKCDCIEGDDTEIMHLTVCNPYKNVTLSNLVVSQLIVVDGNGNPVPNLPNGDPSIELVPIGPHCFDDIAPCTCVTREFVLWLRGAPGGTYHIEVKGICFDACFHGDADACFQFEVCKD
jgi:hypothetical protein